MPVPLFCPGYRNLFLDYWTRSATLHLSPLLPFPFSYSLLLINAFRPLPIANLFAFSPLPIFACSPLPHAYYL